MTNREQWDDYRRRRRIVWQVGIIYLTGLGLVMEYTSIDPLYIFCLFAAAIAVAGMWFQSWPCPRCRQPWSGNAFRAHFFNRKCAHCGFPKWQLEEGGENDEPEVELDAADSAVARMSAGGTKKGSHGNQRVLCVLIVGVAIYAAIRVVLWWRGR